MISDVDEALRNLILDSLTVSRQNVDIKFDLPSRDWAARLNRPTIDLFLFDIRETLRLRGAEQARQIPLSDGRVEVRRNPVRIDLRYLLTAWTKDPEDEHLLLSDALLTLLRNPTIPDKYASEQMKNSSFRSFWMLQYTSRSTVRQKNPRRYGALSAMISMPGLL